MGVARISKKYSDGQCIIRYGLFQAIVDNGRIYVLGQGSVDLSIGKVRGETMSDQTAQTLENINAVLYAAGQALTYG